MISYRSVLFNVKNSGSVQLACVSLFPVYALLCLTTTLEIENVVSTRWQRAMAN